MWVLGDLLEPVAEPGPLALRGPVVVPDGLGRRLAIPDTLFVKNMLAPSLHPLHTY